VGSLALAAMLLASPPDTTTESTPPPGDAPGSSEDSPPKQPPSEGAAAGESDEAGDTDLRTGAPGPDVERESEPSPTEQEDATQAEEQGGVGLLVGELRVAGSRDPIPGAVVARVDGGGQVETDAEGRFELWLPPGQQSLLLRADGFEDRRVQVDVTDGDRIENRYRMLADLDSDRYRTVVEEDLDVAVSRTRLTDEEIREVAGTGGDPFKVVASLPGASQLAGFLPYVVVRGAAPGNTGYYLDGVRVPLLFHVAAGPSVIHPYFIDSVDFYPSGAPVRLGRFASGMVEGRTRRARSDRLRGEIDVRLTDAGALLEVPINRPRLSGCTEEKKRDCPKGPARGSLTFAGRYSYTGLLLSLIPQLNARIQFWDFQARFDHDIGPNVTYRAFAYGAFDLLGQREAPPPDPDGDGNGGIFGGTGDGTDQDDGPPDPFLRFEFYRLDQRIIQRLRGGGEANYKVALGFDRSGLSDAKTNVFRVMPRAQWLAPIRPGLDVGVGIDTEVQVHRLENQASDISVSDAENLALLLSERTVFLGGVWTDLRWEKGRIEMRPGVRFDLYAQNGQSSQLLGARSVTNTVGVDPRLLLRETLNDKWALRQSVGVYHQPPDFPVPVPGIESVGFELGLQRNIQGTLGYEYQVGDIAVLSQDVYLGRLNNLLDFELAQVDDNSGNEVEDFLLQVDGWSFGVETMLKLDPRRRLFGWVAYTLSRSLREYPVGGIRPSAWDQTHILNLVLGYKIGRKWRVGGRVHFNTGRPYTPQTGMNAFESLARSRNSRRLPAFFQFDFRAERIWYPKDWEIHLYLDVANATLNTEILACAGVETGLDEDDGSRSETLDGCANPQGVPYILPALGVRAVF